MFVLFLLVFVCLLILFRIAWWTSVGKELTSWLSVCAILLYAILIVYVPFLYGVWGRMWNLTVSVLDHCLFIYLKCRSAPKAICSTLRLGEGWGGHKNMILVSMQPLHINKLHITQKMYSISTQHISIGNKKIYKLCTVAKC